MSKINEGTKLLTQECIENYPGVKEYDMYHLGWECDTKFWVIPDGRMWSTSHGSLVSFSEEEFIQYKNEMIEYVKKLEEI